MTLVLGFENRPESLAKKAVSFKNGLSSLRQKIFHTIIGLNIPFYPNQPTVGRNEVFFLLFFFL